jgi:hypothetical protein
MTTANILSQLGSPGVSTGFKNRIINGAMVIDQRNAGASVTPANGSYTLDRWLVIAYQASKFSVQQNAGAVTPPVGFSKYLGTTSLSAYSVGASEYFALIQRIEGFNIADLGWGTANAKTVTLSFQVYSSLTGTFGGSLLNGAANRSYPFSYTVSSANTWTTISITIAGDITGTWASDSSTGVQVCFSLGAGSTFSGTAGSWAGAQYNSATGATSVVGTSGATFYITGVQLEVGTTATNFEVRDYGRELILCQRYFVALQAQGIAYSTVAISPTIQPSVALRSAPTATYTGTLRRTNDGVTQTATSPVVGVSSGNIFAVYASSWSTALVFGQAYDGINGALVTLSAEL